MMGTERYVEVWFHEKTAKVINDHGKQFDTAADAAAWLDKVAKGQIGDGKGWFYGDGDS